ncbi:MAG TPA: hypothetical protein VEI26_10145 [Terriglobales bacterium]|nr:hypothetical protein [Terriglobales bacterium]
MSEMAIYRHLATILTYAPRRAWLAVVPSLLVLAVGMARGQKPQITPDSVAQLVQRLMSIEVGLEQMVPPGMSIEAKEVSRKGKSGQDLVVQYHIFVKGVPPGTLFKALSWPPNADKPSVTTPTTRKSSLWHFSLALDTRRTRMFITVSHQTRPLTSSSRRITAERFAWVSFRVRERRNKVL